MLTCLERREECLRFVLYVELRVKFPDVLLQKVVHVVGSGHSLVSCDEKTKEKGEGK